MERGRNRGRNRDWGRDWDMDKQENMNREPGGIRGLCWGSIFQFFTLIKLKFIRRAYEACKWSSVLQEQQGG